MNARQVAAYAMQDYVAESDTTQPKGVVFTKRQLVALIAAALFQFAAFAWASGGWDSANARAARAEERAEVAEQRLERMSDGCAVRLDDGHTVCEPGVVVHESQVKK